MKYGDEPVKKHKLDSLRVLGTVGEVRLMINPIHNINISSSLYSSLSILLLGNGKYSG